MSFRDDLAGVIACDPHYSIHAYAFIFEALEHTKRLKQRARPRSRARRGEAAQHVNGRELCEGARDLALRQYGLMALAVLARWGIHSTSDLGNLVYNLIAAGDLEKTPEDSRADFENVFEFETALLRDYVLALDEVA